MKYGVDVRKRGCLKHVFSCRNVRRFSVRPLRPVCDTVVVWLDTAVWLATSILSASRQKIWAVCLRLTWYIAWRRTVSRCMATACWYITTPQTLQQTHRSVVNSRLVKLSIDQWSCTTTCCLQWSVFSLKCHDKKSGPFQYSRYRKIRTYSNISGLVQQIW